VRANPFEYLLALSIFGQFEFVVRLEIHPELRRRSEIPGKTERSVGSDGALAANDVVDPGDGNPRNSMATRLALSPSRFRKSSASVSPG
jgi:hypothetical protein